jgi:hypothetical protein
MSDRLSPFQRFIRAYRDLDAGERAFALDVVRELARDPAPSKANPVPPRAAKPQQAPAPHAPVVAKARTKAPTPAERRRAAEEAVAIASAGSSPEEGEGSMFSAP